jgi:ribosome-binding factor A
MAKRRAARIAARIHQDVGMLLLSDLRDPRVELVTITRAEVSDDLRHATVFFSVLGDEAKRRTAERGLESARGLIRSRVAQGLGLREAPDIHFQFDPSIEKAIEISKLLEQVAAELPERKAEAEAEAEPEAEPPDEEEDEGE